MIYQIPASLLAALMLKIGGRIRKALTPEMATWHEIPLSQNLNRKAVVGNLKQQFFH